MVQTTCPSFTHCSINLTFLLSYVSVFLFRTETLISWSWLVTPGSPLMKLTYSHIYSYKNKYNPIGGNASINLNKLILQLLVRLFVYSHKNNIKTFRYYSHNILIRLLRSKKDRWNMRNPSKMNEQTKFGKLLSLIKQ